MENDIELELFYCRNDYGMDINYINIPGLGSLSVFDDESGPSLRLVDGAKRYTGSISTEKQIIRRNSRSPFLIPASDHRTFSSEKHTDPHDYFMTEDVIAKFESIVRQRVLNHIESF